MRGNMIKRLRLIKGAKQEEVANYIGTNLSNYRDIEAEREGREIPHKCILKFCEFYGITPNQYYGLEKIVIEIDNVDGYLLIRKG